MFDWIAQNLGTLLISAVLIAIVTSIIISLIRQKKRGKSSCGCNAGSHQVPAGHLRAVQRRPRCAKRGRGHEAERLEAEHTPYDPGPL